MLFRERPTVSRQDIAFDYSSPAELYLSKRGRRHTEYRRFATAAEAIGYAVEECTHSGPQGLGYRSHPDPVRCWRLSVAEASGSLGQAARGRRVQTENLFVNCDPYFPDLNRLFH